MKNKWCVQFVLICLGVENNIFLINCVHIWLPIKLLKLIFIGDPKLKSIDFVQHLNVRHSFEYDDYLVCDYFYSTQIVLSFISSIKLTFFFLKAYSGDEEIMEQQVLLECYSKNKNSLFNRQTQKPSQGYRF